MTVMRLAALSLLVAGCSSEIYLRDGVTDGDTFYLAGQALIDDDPVLQSWVSYSLSRSACQLSIGGNNPARASSFQCELLARRHLVETWQEQRADVGSLYLDALQRVHDSGWLPEYVAANFARKSWAMPDDLDMQGYQRFAEVSLQGHRLETRLTGSWNYARNVRAAQ